MSPPVPSSSPSSSGSPAAHTACPGASPCVGTCSPHPAHTCPRVTCSGRLLAEEAATGTNQPQGSSLAVPTWAPMRGGGPPPGPQGHSELQCGQTGSLRSGGAVGVGERDRGVHACGLPCDGVMDPRVGVGRAGSRGKFRATAHPPVTEVWPGPAGGASTAVPVPAPHRLCPLVYATGVQSALHIPGSLPLCLPAPAQW